MTRGVELATIDLPDFGRPTVEPTLPAAIYEARIAAVRGRMAEAGMDALLVYADREHAANLAYLTGYDPRFEEALLVIVPDRPPALMVGNEGHGYAAISPLELEIILFQVDPRDITIYAGVLVALGITGLAASLIPAGRASRIDPIIALRS